MAIPLNGYGTAVWDGRYKWVKGMGIQGGCQGFSATGGRESALLSLEDDMKWKRDFMGSPGMEDSNYGSTFTDTLVWPGVSGVSSYLLWMQCTNLPI